MLIIGGSGSGKTNGLLSLISNQLIKYILKYFLLIKYIYMKKIYMKKFLINQSESTGLKHFNDPKAFVEYSNDMQGVYKNIEEYNIDKKRKVLIVFDVMIAL